MTLPASEPSQIYGDGARALQDELGTRRLADVLASVTVHAELSDDDVALISAQSSVLVSTVDAEGWPDVSYKGGDVGFVEIVGRSELRLPIYDGNGMMRTMGNIIDTGRVALLFIDTSRPWRVRLHGDAQVSTAPDDVANYHGAEAVVIVTLRRIFPNCGRYIHRDGQISEFVPRQGVETPLPDWKRIDGLRDVLRPADQARLAAEAGEAE